MNNIKLGTLFNLIRQRTSSLLRTLDNNFTIISENRHGTFNPNKRYSKNGTSSETNSCVENKPRKSSRTLQSSGYGGGSNTDKYSKTKGHLSIPTGDPPLILSVRPYPKSRTKGKDTTSNKTLKAGFQQTIMKIPNEILSMYEKWLRDRKSVEMTWDTYFQHMLLSSLRGLQERPKPPLQIANESSVTSTEIASNKSQTSCKDNCVKSEHESETKSDKTEDICEEVTNSKDQESGCPWSLEEVIQKYPQAERMMKSYVTVYGMIQAYQIRGHLAAKVDPLGIQSETEDLEKRNYKPPNIVAPNLVPEISETDLNCSFLLPSYTFIGGKEKTLKFKEIITRLEKVYCQHIGLEFMYFNSMDKIQFVREKFETPGASNLNNDVRKKILKRLTKAVLFELFVAKKWPKTKRFGLEGAETLIPGIKQVIDRAISTGVHTFIIGMAHRGRLNVLTNIIHKELKDIFSQFGSPDIHHGSGDVMYHLGSTVEREINGKKTTLTLMPNPSHLETVSPLVIGRTRSEQFFLGDEEGKQVMSILIHGDAAFSAQGVVYETINLSKLPDFTSRGTIHIIINNQIGFTTDPRVARSSPNCSDLGQITHAPIFRVNGDDPDALIHCCNIAVDFRNRFQRDVVIEIVCYRRHGHSELDDPSFTQPIMYKKIKEMPNVLKVYIKKLSEENVISGEDAKSMCTEYLKSCEKAYQESQKDYVDLKTWLDKSWESFFEKQDPNIIPCTGVKEGILKQIGMKLATPPLSNLQFDLHEGIAKILSNRMELLNEMKVDWSLAEAMAFGSLVLEGYHVRLSGEDVERGTFAQRQSVYHDQTTDKKVYIPLKNLAENQGDCTICNSSLCEYAILGFELGYSMTNPNVLNIWEAQFGDFLDTGQVVVDTYISSSEVKWDRQLGIVLLLPHGLEGQGPEHSSARMERFLQMCDDDPDDMPCLKDHSSIVNQLRDVNWIVAVPSTPANYFHILRRQLKMPFRKPLILFTPKQILKTNRLRSCLSEMTEGTSFQRVIPENGRARKNPKSVKRLIFCSGRVYYDLIAGREERKLQNYIAISRIEQLCPFPYDLVHEETLKYPNAEICWTQEEHKNSGPWSYVFPRFSTVLQDNEREVLVYVGRPPAAAPATGNKNTYEREVKQLINDALDLSFPSSGACGGPIGKFKTKIC